MSALNRVMIFVGVLSLGLVLGNGCQKPDPGTTATAPVVESDGAGEVTAPADPGTPVDGDTFVEILHAEPGMLSPVLALTDAGGKYISAHIFDTLLKMDNETLEFIPNLGERWEISEDKLEYTIYLRKDVTFSDGVPLTAEDVKFTYDLIMDPKTDAASLRNYIQDFIDCDVLDPYTIRFTATKPYFRHMLIVALFDVMPKHIYGEGDINKHPGNRAPIGSGPYIFSEWVTGQEISLVRNPSYWGEKPHLDKRLFKIVTDENAGLQLLQRHEVDSKDLQPEQWVRQAATERFEKEFHKLQPKSPIPGYLGRFGYIGWNMRKPQFEDKRVRTALTMLLDRQLILDEIYHGLGELISGDTAPDLPEYNQNVKPWPFDPEAAKKLLDEAGWIDTNSDGIREKDGADLTFELNFAANVPEYDQMTTIYQEELTRAGIKMTPRPLEWATFQERVHRHDFDACMLAWLTTPLPDPYQLFHSTQAENGSNYPGLIHAEADQIMDAMRLEFEQDKRVVLYHRFHEILHEEQPYTFLFARNGLIAVDKRFQNVKVYKPGLDPLEWWVPTAMQRYK